MLTKMRLTSYPLAVFLIVSLLLTPLVLAGTGVTGGIPEFDATAAEEEGYWYSRYNLGSLTLQSGNGEVFMPSQEVMMKAIQMVDADPNDGDAADPPANPAMLSIVYAGGDPRLTQAMDPEDFATLRWVGGDTRVTTEASAWTIVKELEWAKLFHIDDHFGTPQDNFGAHQRFMGMVMALMPKMQVKAWMEQSDRFEKSLAGDYAMLIALSDGVSLYSAEKLSGSASNRYLDPDAANMFAQAADNLSQKVVASSPSSARDLSLGIQSLVWYAAYTTNTANQAAALDKIAQWGDALAVASTSAPAEHANAVRGLIEAGRASGDNKYLDAAANHFKGLVTSYDGISGIFSGQNSYTTDDVGTILGAVNSARLFLGERVDQAQAESVFAGFFESAVNLSGLQIAAPPLNLFKGTFEQEDPEIYYRYPTTPMPPMAGGDFGIAAVFAASVTWDGSAWSADQSHFDTAGAMRTANEMIWFHNDEISGFPVVTKLAAPATLPTTGGAGSSINLALLLAVGAGVLLLGAGLRLARVKNEKE